jgi:hypothetical protein
VEEDAAVAGLGDAPVERELEVGLRLGRDEVAAVAGAHDRAV